MRHRLDASLNKQVHKWGKGEKKKEKKIEKTFNLWTLLVWTGIH